MTIKLHVASLTVPVAKVKKCFHEILTDYCTRFHVIPTEKPVDISVMFTGQEDDDTTSGMVLRIKAPDEGEQEHKYLVQIRDPWINGWEENPYAIDGFMASISHEFVHICQFLTGRKGIQISRKFYDSADDTEHYYFSPHELEARALSSFYNETITYKILE